MGNTVALYRFTGLRFTGSGSTGEFGLMSVLIFPCSPCVCVGFAPAVQECCTVLIVAFFPPLACVSES